MELLRRSRMQTTVELNEETLEVLDHLIKKYKLKSYSEAINLLADHNYEEVLGLELRPEFIEEIIRAEKEEPIHIGTIEDLRKRYESDEE